MEIPELICYKINSSLEIIPARFERQWMQDTDQKFAYRCIPLSIANASGWEILCSSDFTVTWNGGNRIEDIVINPKNDFVISHFRHGIITFHVGYMFRTSPGWATWFRGPPNSTKTILMPLEGIVETDWLPFTATMNWRFSEPGTVKFEKGEAFCFITLMPHSVLDEIQPIIKNISDNPKEMADFKKWEASRSEFMQKLNRHDPETVAKGWEKKYIRGQGANEHFHVSKRKLNKPILEVF